MNRWTIPFALALAASALGINTALAQPPGVQYPYGDSAPSGFPPAGLNVPLPGPAGYPRDAFRPSGSAFGNAGLGGLGGAGAYSYLNGVRLPAGTLPAPADNRASVWLAVPADAEVWFDGDKTKQTGDLRHFESPPLAPGRSYTYAVRVRWTKDGKPVEEERQISVRAGASSRLDFSQPAGESDERPIQAMGLMRFAVPK